jgi:osmotically-inducible protein OsmY
MAQTNRKSDRQVQADVAGELDCATGLDTARLAISVRGGMVTLSGQVSSDADRLATKRMVGLIPGVRAVVDNLVVRAPGTPGTADADLAALAKRMLGSAADVPANTVQVGVRDRVITLSGDVTSERQRDAASQAVRHIKGAVGLTNDIRVER